MWSVWYVTSTYRYANVEKPIFVDVIEIEEHPPVVLMENRLRS